MCLLGDRAAIVWVHVLVLFCDHVYIKTHRSANIDIISYNICVNKVYNLFIHMKTDFTELDNWTLGHWQPLTAGRPLKFCIFEKPRWRRRPCWKHKKRRLLINDLIAFYETWYADSQMGSQPLRYVCMYVRNHVPPYLLRFTGLVLSISCEIATYIATWDGGWNILYDRRTLHNIHIHE